MKFDRKRRDARERRARDDGAMTSTPEPYATDARRWQAVQARAQAADGHFLYAVSTTGVYCRPSCGARLPRREHVRFYPDADTAERAGYRACMRCRPRGPSLAERQATLIARSCRHIEAAVELPPTTELARRAGMSRFHFQRIFKAITGLTPKGYMDAHRAQRLREQLPQAASVTDAIYDTGFNSGARFYAASTASLGMRPREFRAGGSGQTIRFALADCSLGAVLVAATARGVCALWLGDSADALLRELQDRFPGAQLQGGDAAFDALVGSVIAQVEAPGQSRWELPLDLRGSVFQHRVWHALRALAPGQTISYGELARRIGAPGSARAVARAVAANPVAVAIPCHRVIRSDGSLSGYRWGVQRKRALLEREACGARDACEQDVLVSIIPPEPSSSPTIERSDA